MKSFLIQFKNGDSIYTSLNGNFETAKNYYLGRKFVIDQSEEMIQCVGVVQIG